MAALVIRAIDQETANASGAHLSERDLLLAGELGHAPLKRSVIASGWPLIQGGSGGNDQQRARAVRCAFMGPPVRRRRVFLAMSIN
jgi:hypothetical protein